MERPWNKTMFVAGIVLGFLLGLGIGCVFPFAIVPSNQAVVQRRFEKIEHFFTVYYESTGELPPYKEFADTRGGKISWRSSSPDGKAVLVKLSASNKAFTKDNSATNSTVEYCFSLVGDANVSRPSP